MEYAYYVGTSCYKALGSSWFPPEYTLSALQSSVPTGMEVPIRFGSSNYSKRILKTRIRPEAGGCRLNHSFRWSN